MAQGKRFTNETFIEEARKIHGDKYDYSKVNYVNKTTKVKIICPIHGEFEQRPDDHLHKQAGCPKCGRGVYTQEAFIQKCKEIHGNKYDYSKTIYKSVKDKIIITCPEHGDFEQLTRAHLQGEGCFKCRLKSQTKMFEKILERFPTEHIIFEANKDIVDWIGRQRLDIYFSDYNIAIEYDGIQHLKPIEIFGGEERFFQQQELDKLKEELCTNNKCILFRIKYNYTQDEFNDICSQIEQIISKHHEAGLIEKLDK